MKRRIFSILLVICMMISMMPVTALAEEVAEDGHDHILAQDTQEETVPVTEETVVETTGEVTEETTGEPTEEVTGETTVETTEEVTEEPTVEITEETTVEETQEATQPVTEPEPVCTCESDDPAFHATNCPCYEAPAEPQCFCVEKCEEPNFWCDICGFDISRCGGEDTAATYEGCDHSVTATLGHISGSSNTKEHEAEEYLLDGDPSTKWCGDFGDGFDNYVIFTAGGPSILTSYTLTTGADTGSEFRHYRNWKAWTLYGSNSPDGDWTVIDEVTGAVLPMASNAVSDPFLVDPHTPYTYYKLEVNAVFGKGTPRPNRWRISPSRNPLSSTVNVVSAGNPVPMRRGKTVNVSSAAPPAPIAVGKITNVLSAASSVPTEIFWN